MGPAVHSTPPHPLPTSSACKKKNQSRLLKAITHIYTWCHAYSWCPAAVLQNQTIQFVLQIWNTFHLFESKHNVNDIADVLSKKEAASQVFYWILVDMQHSSPNSHPLVQRSLGHISCKPLPCINLLCRGFQLQSNWIMHWKSCMIQRPWSRNLSANRAQPNSFSKWDEFVIM